MSERGTDAGAPDTTGAVSEVRAAHRIDEAALQRFLGGKLPGAELGLRVQQFEGGQSNPTYLLETGAPGATQRWVLRKKPPGALLASAHMVEREQRIMRALAGSGCPVPAIPVFSEDASIIGTPFFVMEYLGGFVVRDPSMPGATAAARAGTYEAAVETLAALHEVDWKARGLEGFGKQGAYVARQVARWSRQYRDSGHESLEALPAMGFLSDWLGANVPPEPPVTIAHGDYKLDNLVMHPTEPRVLAVLDWELSTLGDPLTDLAYFCMPFHLPAGDKGMRGLVGHDVTALGIPSQAAIVASYCARRGIAVPEPAVFSYYLALAFFRLAAIVAGIAARHRQGNAASATAGDIAAQTSTFAAIGERLARSA